MSEVLVDMAGTVATITINRPERRNALSNGVVRALVDAFAECDRNSEVRVIVLTGAGEKAFCAGGDLTDIQGDGMLGMHWAREGFAELLLTMQRLGKPIIGRVQGQALGGGFGLALNCDLVIASDTATFGTPEIRVGLFPMMIMAVIVRNIGRKAAMEMMLTGERLSAADAKNIGILNRVVAVDELDQAVEELAQKIGSFSPAVLRLGRQAFFKTQDMSFEEALRSLHNELSLNVMSEDASEGVMAFLEGRSPNWSGR